MSNVIWEQQRGQSLRQMRWDQTEKCGEKRFFLFIFRNVFCEFRPTLPNRQGIGAGALKPVAYNSEVFYIDVHPSPPRGNSSR